jgi:nucleoside-diphosphate-sugar epimerase
MNILIFGATGSIGNYMYMKLKEKYNVYGTTSSYNNNFFHVKLENNKLIHNLLEQNIPKLDGIIWAHGKNINDSINTFCINDFNRRGYMGRKYCIF